MLQVQVEKRLPQVVIVVPDSNFVVRRSPRDLGKDNSTMDARVRRRTVFGLKALWTAGRVMSPGIEHMFDRDFSGFHFPPLFTSQEPSGIVMKRLRGGGAG